MAPIILCSILALTIIAERFWALRRSKVVPDGVGEQVEEWSARHELDRRHIDQLRSGSALGRVLAAALVNRHRSRDLIKEAVEDTGRHVVHQLERFLNTLGTIAGISPLLGLLGTVIGMIKVFSAIMAHGVGNANQLAGGISEALITTLVSENMGPGRHTVIWDGTDRRGQRVSSDVYLARLVTAEAKEMKKLVLLK